MKYLTYSGRGSYPGPTPEHWSGYQELIGSRQRFRILDVDQLLRLLGNADLSEFRQHYESSIQERLAKDLVKREPHWTESIAVGRKTLLNKSRGKSKGGKFWKSKAPAMRGF